MPRAKPKGRKKTLTPEQRKERFKATQKRWKKANMTAVTFRLTNEGDADIIEFIRSADSKVDLFRDAIREYMANHQDD